MQKIQNIKNNYYVEPIDAVINGDYITPGINGKKVDELASYYNMKNSKNFNESLLVFEEIIPKISITNNKNKIINHGNSQKNSVSLIINNSTIEKYCDLNNIIYQNDSDENYCFMDLIECTNEKYYIKSSYELNNNTFYLNTILSGDIIYISDLSLEYFKYLLLNLHYQNIKIVSFDYLISEAS